MKIYAICQEIICLQSDTIKTMIIVVLLVYVVGILAYSIYKRNKHVSGKVLLNSGNKIVDSCSNPSDGNIQNESDLQRNRDTHGIIENEIEKRDIKENPNSNKFACNDNIANDISSGKKQYNQEKEENNVPSQDISYVNYSIPNTIKSTNGFYFDISFPKKGSVVFPFRRTRIERRGYTEEMFEKELCLELSGYSSDYIVLGDVAILPNDGCHPYEPDISIIETGKKLGVRIDIEIDEPYSGYNKTPIHYIGCGDEYRDKKLANLGWIVIRFSEKQIFYESKKCINLVKHLISLIDSRTPRVEYSAPAPDKHWTKIEAEKMIVERCRERLLNHEFGELEIPKATNQDTKQTEIEKEASKKVAPFVLEVKTPKNIDCSETKFPLDEKISFEPNEHIYVYDGFLEMTPVSNLISLFFHPFDPIAESEKYARKHGGNQIKIMEDWDCLGKESREIGTFLHSQIESYFENGVMNAMTHFQYKGIFINEDKSVSIQREISHFRSFLDDNSIEPFRTEWHIYDLTHKIAGTIDLLCRNGKSYDIYDWKRSRKACADETIWRYGINGLEHIPDIKRYHYALQQNIYKYILETNYGITIENMYIVVFHPSFNTYVKLKIPNLKKEVNTILEYVRTHR